MPSELSCDLLSSGALLLVLGELCIQGAARRAHCSVTRALLAQEATDGRLAAAAETLERFLTTTDFAALRSRHPELAGGHACRVRLERKQDGSVSWQVVEP